jgi:GTP-binding protein HflX
VGYTNAGKSTLFNALVKAGTYAADQLFATWTPPRAALPGEAAQVSLSDTVGFIRDLPHKLVEAFEATLQEAADADLLLHVVDAASPVCWSRSTRSSVCWTRSAPASCPRCWSSTSCDLPEHQRPRTCATVWSGPGAPVPRVFVSALKGEGLGVLREVLARSIAWSATGA